jgi:hypothetical protein
MDRRKERKDWKARYYITSTHVPSVTIAYDTQDHGDSMQQCRYLM